jgi:hypothetical protein
LIGELRRSRRKALSGSQYSRLPLGQESPDRGSREPDCFKFSRAYRWRAKPPLLKPMLIGCGRCQRIPRLNGHGRMPTVRSQVDRVQEFRDAFDQGLSPASLSDGHTKRLACCTLV